MVVADSLAPNRSNFTLKTVLYGLWLNSVCSLQCHNELNGVSNHQPHHCLLKHLFRRRSKKTSKLSVTGLCVGNSRVTGEFPHKGPVTQKMLPFDDLIIFLCEYFHCVLHCLPLSAIVYTAILLCLTYLCLVRSDVIMIFKQTTQVIHAELHIYHM